MEGCCRRKITTGSTEETRLLGERLGARLGAGSVVALTGDLGSGKTSFIQGLARGLDVPENYYVTSPTYTLINEYQGRYRLFHVDLYRIEDPADFEEIGLYEILRAGGVVAIEWADRLPEGLLSEHIAVHIEILSDESRKICVAAYFHGNLDFEF